uniref:Uncharacterized protein n=1 Tax=Ornithorhynchus anatinus TaxID=9258 RepID=A0A6I8ND04_ORNAN
TRKSGWTQTLSHVGLARKEGRPGGQWHPDVRPLVSSERWLRLHGLRRNKLTLSQIVSQLGFPRREGFIRSLGRRVASRYAVGLFHQYATPEGGKVYNVSQNGSMILIHNLINITNNNDIC